MKTRLLLVALWIVSSKLYAQNPSSEHEPNIWEKAKSFTDELWNGKTQKSDESSPPGREEKSKGRSVDPKDSKKEENESSANSENEPKEKDSKENRGQSYGSLFYIPFSTGIVLPTKKGFSATWILNSSSSLEAEYLSGSYGFAFTGLDLALFSEKIISAKYRYYTGNSFNWIFGVGQRKYKFSIGNDLLAIATDQVLTSYPALVVENNVVILGLGNRWQFDNGFTIGADWVELLVPFGSGKIENETLAFIKKDDDQDKTEKIIRFLRYGPTFTLLKVALGYTF